MLFENRKALFPGFSGKEKPALFVTFHKSNNGSPAAPAGSATHAPRENRQAALPPFQGGLKSSKALLDFNVRESA